MESYGSLLNVQCQEHPIMDVLYPEMDMLQQKNHKPLHLKEKKKQHGSIQEIATYLT